MQLDWSFARPVDVGGMIRQGIEEGVQGGAMNALLRNPNDRGAMSRLGMVNPQAALGMQDRQAQLAAREEQTRTRQIENEGRMLMAAASFLEGVNDPQTYAAARQQFMTMFPDARNVPEQFDPNLVATIRDRAQRWHAFQSRSSGAQQQPTGLQREYEYLSQNFGPQVAQQYITRRTEPTPMFIPDGRGGGRIVPRGLPGAAPSGPQPGAVEDGYRFNGGDPGDPNNWERVEGGSGSAAPSNFPGDEWIPTDAPHFR